MNKSNEKSYIKTINTNKNNRKTKFQSQTSTYSNIKASLQKSVLRSDLKEVTQSTNLPRQVVPKPRCPEGKSMATFRFKL